MFHFVLLSYPLLINWLRYKYIILKNNGKEICRYNLSEDGKNNTAIIFADLYREGEEWNFSALGELKQSSIRSLYNSYKG